MKSRRDDASGGAANLPRNIHQMKLTDRPAAGNRRGVLIQARISADPVGDGGWQNRGGSLSGVARLVRARGKARVVGRVLLGFLNRLPRVEIYSKTA
jgi:hypothetical protein